MPRVGSRTPFCSLCCFLAQNYRHVIKALSLLDFLIKNGSDRVAEYAMNRRHELTTLKDFQHIDDQGKDQGANVRHKSKELTLLLGDPEKIREERRKAKQLNERMSNTSSGHTSAYDSRDRYYEDSRSSSNAGRTEHRESQFSSGLPPTTDSERDLQRAIEESRVTYQQEQQRYAGASLDAPPSANSRSQHDGFADFQSAGKADPFGDSFAAPAAPKPAPVSAQDLFGDSFAAPPAAKQAQDPFADAFGAPPAAAPAARQAAPATRQSAPVDLFALDAPPQQSGFNAAFDGGHDGKKLPHELAGKNDPNAMLANIARNAYAHRCCSFYCTDRRARC